MAKLKKNRLVKSLITNETPIIGMPKTGIRGRAIIRKGLNREKPYVIIEKTILQDKNLSWKARGILGYLLSLPENWTLYVKELLAHSERDGEKATRTGLNELIKFGYIHRRPARREDGRFRGQEYLVYEDPADNSFFNKKTCKVSVGMKADINDPFFDDCELPTREHTQYDINRTFRDMVDAVEEVSDVRIDR
jgi:hypothetical protein